MATAGFHTIQISSRVSAQGEFVEHYGNGEMLVRDGNKLYRGWPIAMKPGTPITDRCDISPMLTAQVF